MSAYVGSSKNLKDLKDFSIKKINFTGLEQFFIEEVPDFCSAIGKGPFEGTQNVKF